MKMVLVLFLFLLLAILLKPKVVGNDWYQAGRGAPKEHISTDYKTIFGKCFTIYEPGEPAKSMVRLFGGEQEALFYMNKITQLPIPTPTPNK